jgi:hypothetical protein
MFGDQLEKEVQRAFEDGRADMKRHCRARVSAIND